MRRRRLASRWTVVAVVATGGGAVLSAALGNQRLAVLLIAIEVTIVALALLDAARRTARAIRSTAEKQRALAQNTARSVRRLRRHVLASVARHEDVLASVARHEAALESVAGRPEARAARLDRLDEQVAALREVVDARATATAEATAAVHRTADQILAAITDLAAAGQSMATRERYEADHRAEQTLREIEALMQLFAGRPPEAPMPPSAGWALRPTGLLELLYLVKRAGPALVVELGSGTSTVWLGHCLHETGARLVSIDHDADFAEHTRSMVARHGLQHVADVRVAPLRPLQVDEETYEWYDTEVFADLYEIGVLVVDGPPGRDHPMARFPALPILRDRLAGNAVIFLDDVQRPDEQAIVTAWLARDAGLRREPTAFTGHAVLRLEPPADPADAAGAAGA